KPTETRSGSEPMTLGNMRHFGAHHLIATCLSDACRHQGLIDVSKYPADTEVPWFASKAVCAKYGARGRQVDARPNGKEQPMRPTVLRMRVRSGKNSLRQGVAAM